MEGEGIYHGAGEAIKISDRRPRRRVQDLVPCPAREISHDRTGWAERDGLAVFGALSDGLGARGTKTGESQRLFRLRPSLLTDASGGLYPAEGCGHGVPSWNEEEEDRESG